MKKKSKLKKFFISIAIILVVVIVVPLFIFTFEIKAEWFSEEQHAKRITRRIEKKIKSGYYDATDFEVYPLYTLDEELRYFLVEFEPKGYTYILVNDPWIFGGMYKLTSGRAHPWNPCNVEQLGKTQNVVFDYYENGSKIVTVQSPYRYRGKLNEKKYLLKFNSVNGLVPAVKNGNNFVNLYADYEFTVDGEGHIKKETIELFDKACTTTFSFHGKYNYLY